MTLREASKEALDLLQQALDAETDVYDYFHHRDLADQHYEVVQKLRAALIRARGENDV